MLFAELIALLPKARQFALTDPAVGIAYQVHSDLFVAPQVDVDRELRSAQVLIIVAPAAVGKTTIARELAAATGAPLWDLSTRLVGSNSFVGGLAQAFGPAQLPGVLAGFTSGATLLVLDALDETHLRSGYNNLEAFIGDIAQVVASAPSVPLVLLARVETAVVAQLMLESAGAVVATATLQYFGEDDARHFIDRRLAAHWASEGKPAVHHRNPAVYREAVDGMFEFVYGCLGVERDDPWSIEPVRTFLGYAPVLEAIADYLKVENLQSVVADIEATRAIVESGGSGPWAFLNQVVAAMVVRERNKVIPQVRQLLEEVASREDWDAWDDLYLSEEQVDRVLRRHFRVSLFSDRMPVVPVRVRDAYEEALAPVADQHPFLKDARLFSNIVFREYALAWALVRGSGSVRGEAVRLVGGQGYLPTPLLGRFMLELADRRSDGLPLVAGSEVGLVYESLNGSAVQEGEFLLLVIGVEARDSAEARIVRGADERSEASFAIADFGPIIFLHHLAHADVSFAGTVQLGTSSQPFALGPDVVVATGIIETPAREYVVLGDENDFGVRLEAQLHVDGDQLPTVKVYSEAGFWVTWDEVAHPWYPYRDDIPTWEESPRLAGAFADLTSILGRFRRHGRGDFAKKKELIDNVVVGRYISERTADARELLGYLLETGVLREGRGLYFADLEPLGMSWTDVRTRHMTDGARSYLDGFLARVLEG